MAEWKEYITVENLTLIVSVATLIVSIISFRYTRKNRKRDRQELIARKEAQIRSIEKMMRNGLDHSVVAHYMFQKEELRAEIEELKKGL